MPHRAVTSEQGHVLRKTSLRWLIWCQETRRKELYKLKLRFLFSTLFTHLSHCSRRRDLYACYMGYFSPVSCGLLFSLGDAKLCVLFGITFCFKGMRACNIEHVWLADRERGEREGPLLGDLALLVCEVWVFRARSLIPIDQHCPSGW